MRFVITGANGFIGSHLARLLVNAGHEVTGLVRPKSRLQLLGDLPLKLERADLRDPASLLPVVRGAEVVFHTAGLTKARSLAAFMAANAQGSLNLASACASCETPPTLLLVSSLAAAGPSRADRPAQEPDPALPISNYGKSKLAGENAVRQFAGDVPITIVRPPIVFGLGDENVRSFVQSVLRRGVHVVPGPVAGRHSLIHAGDLAAGLLQAARHAARLPAEPDGQQTGIYYMASDEQPAFDELGQIIGQALGRPNVRVVYLPRPLVWAAAALADVFDRARGKIGLLNTDKMREAMGGHWVCSASRAKADLGFRVAAPLGERIREVADQMRSAGVV